MTMQSRTMTAIVSLLAAGALTPASGLAGGPASRRAGDVHIIKECSHYTGAAGSFCTITESNVAEIPAGSRVNYDQGIYPPASGSYPGGLLDSNVVLDAGNGNAAIGRCTLDGATNLGVCTFTDGTGNLAGFHARVNIAPTTGVYYSWIGTYHFAEVGE
jgi:hypothetical protein